jgi:hypothetical protein
MIDPILDLLDLQKGWLGQKDYQRAALICRPLLEALASQNQNTAEFKHYQALFDSNLAQLENDKTILSRRLSRLKNKV